MPSKKAGDAAEAKETKKTAAPKGADKGEAKTAKAPKSGGAKKAASGEGTPRKAGGALQQPLTPSPELGKVVGAGPLPRGEVVSKIWEYIRNNNLQNPENRREILADDKLKPIFGKDKVTMFEMNKYLSQHLK